jgi:UDP-N-acetylglucosamine:LPS N-acetylglucosamine transferase
VGAVVVWCLLVVVVGGSCGITFMNSAIVELLCCVGKNTTGSLKKCLVEKLRELPLGINNGSISYQYNPKHYITNINESLR